MNIKRTLAALFLVPFAMVGCGEEEPTVEDTLDDAAEKAGDAADALKE
jgi:hypothetical protein